MKATELLQRQHREIEQLLDRLQGAAPEEQAAIREELASLLVAHTVIEQEHFYPAVRASAPGLVLEAVEEHGLANFELGRGVTTRPGDESMMAKSAVLAEIVVAHIRKEEADLFRRAENNLTNQELSELAEMMEARFVQVRQMGYLRFLVQAIAVATPRLRARTTSARKARQTASAHAPKRGAARRTATARRAGGRKAQGAQEAQGTQKAQTSREAQGTQKAQSSRAAQGTQKAQRSRAAQGTRKAQRSRAAQGTQKAQRSRAAQGARKGQRSRAQSKRAQGARARGAQTRRAPRARAAG